MRTLVFVLATVGVASAAEALLAPLVPPFGPQSTLDEGVGVALVNCHVASLPVGEPRACGVVAAWNTAPARTLELEFAAGIALTDGKSAPLLLLVPVRSAATSLRFRHPSEVYRLGSESAARITQVMNERLGMKALAPRAASERFFASALSLANSSDPELRRLGATDLQGGYNPWGLLPSGAIGPWLDATLAARDDMARSALASVTIALLRERRNSPESSQALARWIEEGHDDSYSILRGLSKSDLPKDAIVLAAVRSVAARTDALNAPLAQAARSCLEAMQLPLAPAAASDR